MVTCSDLATRSKNGDDTLTEAITATTNQTLPLRLGTFATLTEALEYAAGGETGYNFHNGRGALEEAVPYAVLRDQAQDLARRLLGCGLERGERVALIGETWPGFVRFFFACQYAGLVPVPLPATLQLGGHRAYVKRLRALVQAAQAAMVASPASLTALVSEAVDGLGIAVVDEGYLLADCKASTQPLVPSRPHELAYLQFTSGSTRFPRGVMITQQAVMANLQGIVQHGLAVRPGDRCVSWLPFYHDMGLVGLVLGPLASQLSVDYLRTSDFAMRPRQWLHLMSRLGATISFGPPFGYELCARRLRPADIAELRLDAWRVAGVGAETIRIDSLRRFAQLLEPAGFDARAFVPCYGMAECSLAVSFAPLGEGVVTECLDGEILGRDLRAVPASNETARRVELARCGRVLPGLELVVRDGLGRPVAKRTLGVVHVRGPSVMEGYFADPVATAAVLSPDGWLNTGDVGYMADGELVITGRVKDMIVIHGRNIWPQDLEMLAEQHEGVRPGDSSAFAVVDPGGGEVAVLVIQCRAKDEQERNELIGGLRTAIQAEFGIDCLIDLVPPHTLPRTSSGKLSRSGARQDFLRRRGWPQADTQAMGLEELQAPQSAVG